MSRTRKPPKKSPSERLRNALYGVYMKEKPMISFDEYYENKMEIIIEHFKNK